MAVRTLPIFDWRFQYNLNTSNFSIEWQKPARIGVVQGGYRCVLFRFWGRVSDVGGKAIVHSALLDLPIEPGSGSIGFEIRSYLRASTFIPSTAPEGPYNLADANIRAPQSYHTLIIGEGMDVRPGVKTYDITPLVRDSLRTFGSQQVTIGLFPLNGSPVGQERIFGGPSGSSSPQIRLDVEVDPSPSKVHFESNYTGVYADSTDQSTRGVIGFLSQIYAGDTKPYPNLNASYYRSFMRFLPTIQSSSVVRTALLRIGELNRFDAAKPTLKDRLYSGKLRAQSEDNATIPSHMIDFNNRSKTLASKILPPKWENIDNSQIRHHYRPFDITSIFQELENSFGNRNQKNIIFALDPEYPSTNPIAGDAFWYGMHALGGQIPPVLTLEYDHHPTSNPTPNGFFDAGWNAILRGEINWENDDIRIVALDRLPLETDKSSLSAFSQLSGVLGSPKTLSNVRVESNTLKCGKTVLSQFAGEAKQLVVYKQNGPLLLYVSDLERFVRKAENRELHLEWENDTLASL